MSEARDALRAKVLSSKKPKSKRVIFFGDEIELRQPTLGAIFDAREQLTGETAVVSTLIKYAFVPDTDERLFEDTDTEVLLSMPFGVEFVDITEALQELTSINFLNKRLSSKPPPSDSQ